jgi:hypothetical protein
MAKKIDNQPKWVREIRVSEGKVTLVIDDRDWRALDEEAIEHTWKVSGNLHILADRLGLGLARGEVSPALAWVHKALLERAEASRPKAETKRIGQDAVKRARYVAVREAHDREGLLWENAYARAAELLHGQPAGASAETMRRDYKEMRKSLREAGVRNDDPGYRWVDTDKS